MDTSLKKPLTASVVLEGEALHCSGTWKVLQLAQLEEILADVNWPKMQTVQFDMENVTALDTAGALLLHRLVQQLAKQGCVASIEGLSPDARILYEYISQRGLGSGSSSEVEEEPMFEKLGRADVAKLEENIALLSFVGELSTSAVALLFSPRRIRWKMILKELGEAGYKALPIVGLLTFLLGVVIAYQGAAQLRQYGANIFIADLVGLSMIRELSLTCPQ